MATVLRVEAPAKFAYLLEEALATADLEIKVEVSTIPNHASARYVRVTLPCEHKGKIIALIDGFAVENGLKHTLIGGAQPTKNSH